jgi:hypothetical protein
MPGSRGHCPRYRTRRSTVKRQLELGRESSQALDHRPSSVDINLPPHQIQLRVRRGLRLRLPVSHTRSPDQNHTDQSRRTLNYPFRVKPPLYVEQYALDVRKQQVRKVYYLYHTDFLMQDLSHSHRPPFSDQMERTALRQS